MSETPEVATIPGTGEYIHWPAQANVGDVFEPNNGRRYEYQQAGGSRMWVDVGPGGGGGMVIPEPVGPAVYGRTATQTWVPVLPVGVPLAIARTDADAATAGVPLHGYYLNDTTAGFNMVCQRLV